MVKKKKSKPKTKSKVNEAGNYTKPGMRKALFEKIKAGSKGGARKADKSLWKRASKSKKKK